MEQISVKQISKVQSSQLQSSHIIRRGFVSQLDLTPNLWRSESLEYTLPEGGKGSCKRCKRSTQPSLSGRRCDWLRPVGSRLRTSPVNWAFLTHPSINGARS